MPQAVGAWLGTYVSGWIVAAAEVAAIYGLQVASTRAAEKEAEKHQTFARDMVIASAKAPQQIVYGESFCGGVIMYANSRSEPGAHDNFQVIKAIAHCARECESITDLYYDNDLVTDAAHIDWGGGIIDAGKYGLGQGGTWAVKLEKYLGTAAQTQSPLLSTISATDYPGGAGGVYRARGICYTVHMFTYFSYTAKTPEGIFYSGVPQNIRAKIKGAKVYDPRLDGTNGGTGAQRFATPSTWTWSENPILCATDYMTQYMSIAFARMDWDWIRAQADICDVQVLIPPVSPATYQSRYTCNGVISLGNTHGDNLEQILSSCAGSCPKVSGKWRPTAGAYVAADVSISEVDIVGDIVMSGSVRREDRYNTVKSIYASVTDYGIEVDALPLTDAGYVTRDGGTTLVKTLMLPLTNSEYQAQRIAYKKLLQSDRQITCSVPLRWTGLQIAIGTRVSLTYSKFGWSAKVFRCAGWKLGGDSPVTVMLIEDDSAAWADPAVANYSTRSAQGIVTPGTIDIPTPTAGGAAGEITIQNANFEIGNWYWTVSGSSWVITLDSTKAHQGSYVLVAVTPTASRVTNYVKFPCTAGDYVTFGGWYKTSASLTGGIGFGVSWLDSAGAELSVKTKAITVASTTWKQIKQEAALAPAGTHWVQFYIYTAGTTVGTVYADDTFMVVQSGTTGAPSTGNILAPYMSDFEFTEQNWFWQGPQAANTNLNTFAPSTTQKTIGTKSIKISSNAGDTRLYIVMARHPGTSYPIITRPNRRFLLLGSIYPDTNASGNWSWRLNASGGGTDSSGTFSTTANQWNSFAIELDRTALTETAFQLVFHRSISATAIAYLDAVMLLDVTDSPWITTTNYPSEYIAGSLFQDVTALRLKTRQTDSTRVNNTLAETQEVGQWMMGPALQYRVRCHFMFTGNATADVKFQWQFTQTPVLARGTMIVTTNTGGAENSTTSIDLTAVQTILYSVNSDTVIVDIDATVETHATLPAEMQLWYAQNTTSASPSLSFKKGSWVSVTLATA